MFELNLESQIHPFLLKSFTIVIPAYNEESRINNVLNSVCSFISTYNLPWEVIVAVDGNDHTNDIVEKYHNYYSFVFSKKTPGRNGMGSAIRRGITFSKGEFIIIMDADGSAKLENIVKEINLLETYDVINFDRYSSSGNYIPIKRRLASRGFNLILKTLFGLQIKDTQCGYKIMKRTVAESVMNRITFSNAFFLTAFFLHSGRMDIMSTEVPLEYNHTDGSKFNVVMTSVSYLVSITAFIVKNSKFFKYTPSFLKELYYKKFRYL